MNKEDKEDKEDVTYFWNGEEITKNELDKKIKEAHKKKGVKIVEETQNRFKKIITG